MELKRLKDTRSSDKTSGPGMILEVVSVFDYLMVFVVTVVSSLPLSLSLFVSFIPLSFSLFVSSIPLFVSHKLDGTHNDKLKAC